MKTTHISAGEYLWIQLDKHRKIDPVKYILKQFENQTLQHKTYTNNEQINSVPTGNSTSDKQQEKSQHNTGSHHNQGKIKVKNEQKDNLNNMPLHSNIMEKNEKSDTYNQSRYGRIIRKPDRLTYSIIYVHVCKYRHYI